MHCRGHTYPVEGNATLGATLDDEEGLADIRLHIWHDTVLVAGRQGIP